MQYACGLIYTGIAGFCFFQKQVGFAWFRNGFKIVRAMEAAIAAAMPSFQVVLFGKHHQAMFIVIKINVFNQGCVHVSGLSGLHLFQAVNCYRCETAGNVLYYFRQCPGFRNRF